MVSPSQAAAGAFFGGPIALAWLLRGNYAAAGDPAAARKTWAVCLLLVLAWNAAFALLPNPMPLPLRAALVVAPLALAIAAYRIARRQIARADRHPVFCSNARVVGAVALCILVTGLCRFAAILAGVVIALAGSGFR
jgi:hypothetical protein